MFNVKVGVQRIITTCPNLIWYTLSECLCSKLIPPLRTKSLILSEMVLWHLFFDIHVYDSFWSLPPLSILFFFPVGPFPLLMTFSVVWPVAFNEGHSWEHGCGNPLKQGGVTCGCTIEEKNAPASIHSQQLPREENPKSSTDHVVYNATTETQRAIS